MPKTKTEVDQQALTAAIKSVEKSATFTSQNAMFAAAAERYSEGKGITKISGAVARSRALEFKIPFTTPKGKKGNFSKNPVKAAAQVKQ